MPSSVLLQPCPPIILSSTHPLHQSPLRHGRRSLGICEAADRFTDAVAKALPIVAAALVLLLHPHFICFFFFFVPLRQSKKEAIVLGGVREDRGRFVSTKGGLRLVERDAARSRPALIGEESEVLINMHKGAMKRPLQQWRLEGPPPPK